MTMKSILSLAVLLGLTSSTLAAPSKRADTFKLTTTVLNYDLTHSIEGYEVSYNMTEPCRANLILGQPGTGVDFYTTPNNGGNVGVNEFPTPSGSSVQAGTVVSPGGTATVPSLNTVEASCEGGTPGVILGRANDLQYEDGTFMACPNSVLNIPGEEFVVLSYKQRGQRTLYGCADVRLVARS